MEEQVKCAVLIIKLYELAPAGGYAHIVFDDGNEEDHHIDGCIKSCEAMDMWPISKREQAITLKALRMFREFDADQKKLVIDIWSGRGPVTIDHTTYEVKDGRLFYP